MSRARITIGIMGMDQHENGAVAVSRYLREAQMEVHYAGLFNTPDQLLTRALEEDADVIGVSCHSWEYTHYLPLLMQRLQDLDREIPVVVGGSVLTPRDRAELEKLGVAATFPAGSDPDDIVDTIRQLARSRVAARLTTA
jgi:methylmalonyl-CoA mutase C-terminal domain/subunit